MHEKLKRHHFRINEIHLFPCGTDSVKSAYFFGMYIKIRYDKTYFFKLLIIRAILLFVLLLFLIKTGRMFERFTTFVYDLQAVLS